MSYSKACEILDLTTPKSLSENARLASGILSRLTDTAPLRYKVAAQIIIEAAK
jgi:hypothetical protein